MLLGLLCFVLFLTEGSVLDWSAVFLTTQRDAGSAYAGLGYAAFAFAMTVGRLAGDAIVRRVGRARVMVLGSLCAAAGLALAVLVPVWWGGVAGYALVGAAAPTSCPSCIRRWAAKP